ncbi:peptidyl-prolyl cis-trans isomerase SDCCAG10 [Marchantia polymorpha subsp. ruderalis]|uniref:PPIase cyclophilin-type domain-containing protein n=2 Tax=Marchantia polymorpha TaxID=3197 RepID=A0AAF6B7Q5_MARPO|nr:hypothetical protein MARPO_0120s0015 [Marchantia polymorpha]PTQ30733.1 hypothetical protein MARPO_0120s0015 [Marchantia polymorpha]BBN08039.1 hypothetical protein Mp_4g08310 [Marchantia polymorpha subsp. ruderalis]BBN08040.1 hypothetical protein Mp_4g08310 [Marchantia polymorpha subsp. ruderalis]|eukprot:PTQ30732.1 hypothetical protein MARPO_0120s0015 [Marchantia polymorpha]
MSSIYVLEPPTKGKVLLNTSLGPLDFELWPKEAPKAVRNFVQLCLEGYYDNTVFHRIIKTFMIQGGDPTGSGTGGDTIYGEPFADEFHSRLRFNHRGLVACANAGSANSNNSQFFMTLERCDWLDKKHTIFGKVTGETIYNLIKIGEVETDKEDRPLDPPKILSVEVLWNPFDDIVIRNLRQSADVQEATEAASKEKKGRKVKKELNLLSFGEEAEEEEQQLAAVKEKKIRSSHDVLQDPRLLKAASDALEVDPTEAKRRKGVQESVRQALGGSGKDNAVSEHREREAPSHGSDEDEVDFDKRMREQIMKKRMNLADSKTIGSDRKQGKSSTTKKSSVPPATPSSRPDVPSRHEEKSREDDDSDSEGGTKKEKLSIKKRGLGSEARAEAAATADLDMQLLSPLEQQRARFKQRKRTLQGREENTLAKLEKFKKKLLDTKDKSVKSAEATKAEDDEGWLAHSLKFIADPKKDDMSRNEDPNQYIVQDPLLEKGKEKFNKMQAKMKKRGKEWAGNSLT